MQSILPKLSTPKYFEILIPKKSNVFILSILSISKYFLKIIYSKEFQSIYFKYHNIFIPKFLNVFIQPIPRYFKHSKVFFNNYYSLKYLFEVCFSISTNFFTPPKEKLFSCSQSHGYTVYLFGHPSHHGLCLVQIQSWCPQLLPLVLTWFISLPWWRHLPSVCVDGQPVWISSITLVLLALKCSTHSYTFQWFIMCAPYSVLTSGDGFLHVCTLWHIVPQWYNCWVDCPYIWPCCFLCMASYTSSHATMWCHLSVSPSYMYNLKIATTFWLTPIFQFILKYLKYF